jgi:hypothetical protein
MTIRIEGVDELIRKLGKVEGPAVLRKPMEEAVSLVQREMKVYPVARPESKYRRTKTLGRRWTRKVTQSPNGVTGIVGNNTTYAPWVQSSQFQAWMHQGRWTTDKQAIEMHTDTIVERFRRAIHNALARG